MLEKYKKEIFYSLLVVFTAVSLFSLGYFASNILQIKKPTIIVEKTDNIYTTEKNDSMQDQKEEQVVASVNSDKYHYLRCPGVKAIKEENKITFKNANEAQLAGFSLAGNCK